MDQKQWSSERETGAASGAGANWRQPARPSVLLLWRSNFTNSTSTSTSPCASASAHWKPSAQSGGSMERKYGNSGEY